MKLIMVISLMESLIHCGLSIMPYICTFKLNKFFALTVFMSDDIYHQVRAVKIIEYASVYLAFFALNFVLMLNIMLCIDLILMVRYPFERKERRLIKYFGSSFLISGTVNSIVMYGTWTHKKIDLLSGQWIVFAQTVFYVFLFVFSVIYTCKKLSGNRMSS